MVLQGKLTKVAPALGSKSCSDHTTTDAGGCELGGDNGGQRVVTANTDTENETPNDESTKNANSRASSTKSLGECGEDDEDKLDTV